MKSAYKLALLLAAGLLVIVLAYYISQEPPADTSTASAPTPADIEARQPGEADDTTAPLATPEPPARPATTPTTGNAFLDSLQADLAAAKATAPTANQPATTTPPSNAGPEAAAPATAEQQGPSPTTPARANDALALDTSTNTPNAGPEPVARAAGEGPGTPTTPGAPTPSLAAPGAQQTRAAVAATPRPTPPGAPTPATPSTTNTPGTPATYTIQAGDTFASIAEARLGNERRWVDIAQANPLVDPARLKIGQIIRLPGAGSTAAPGTATITPAPRDAAEQPGSGSAPANGVIYTIEPGDTLSAIAEQYYNDPNLWNVIYQANRNVIKNPDNIPLGRQIRIPPAPRGAQ